MNYPCGIIRDLLPLYMDDVCSTDSRQAVQEHLPVCEKCRKYYETMKSTDGFAETQHRESEDMKMEMRLKHVKSKLNRKITGMVLCAAAAVFVLTASVHLLFASPLKNVPLQDVSVSADVYSLTELAANSADSAAGSEVTAISSGENDTSASVNIKIPALGMMTLTEDTIERCEYATVVSIRSEYFLKTIKKEVRGDTIYITAFKTTFFSNRAEEYQKQIYTLQLQKINRIVFVDDSGRETTLWSRQN